MATHHRSKFGASRVSNARFIMVLAGVALFVIGFLVTVATFSQTNVGGTQDGRDTSFLSDNERFGGEADILVLLGIVTSLVGVVVATVGPTISVMRSRDRIV